MKRIILFLLCIFTLYGVAEAQLLQSATAFRNGQKITWGSDPGAMTVGDADQTLQGDHATTSSGLTVTFTDTNDAGVCTIVSNKLHAVGAGTCHIHADQAGDGSYYAAAQVASGNVTISAGGGTENIGYATAPASTVGMAADYMYCYKAPALTTQNGEGTSIVWTFTVVVDGNTHVDLSIYNHDAVNNVPSTVVTNSASGSMALTAGTSDQTFTYTGTKPVIATGTQYWVCMITNGVDTNPSYFYDNSGSTLCAYKAMTFGNHDDWAGSAGGTWANRRYGKAYFVNTY
jgi:hypothetical protein